MKPRIKNEKELALTRSKPCLACGRRSDAAHIKSKGSGGNDETGNLVPLCRQHHSEQHQLGWVRFSRKYQRVAWALLEKGWAVQRILGVEKLVRSLDGNG